MLPSVAFRERIASFVPPRFLGFLTVRLTLLPDFGADTRAR
jgi:hypothetical protein